MKRYIRSSTSDGVILYRSGSVDPDIVANSPKGVFFTTSPEYFQNHPQMSFKENYQQYVLLPNARVWEPQKDFEVFDAEGYDKIYCLLSDLDKFGIEDECDWEVDEGYGITSTDGLALTGKKLGYDATVIHDIWYLHGYFDEYAVYNPNIIKSI